MKKFVGAINVKVSNHISEDLALSILSKLPLKSLKRFGCVCKSWVLLFENLYFLNMYRNYFISSNHFYYDDTYILLNSTTHLFSSETPQSTLYLLSGERFENMVKVDWPPPFHEDDSLIYILSKTSVNETLCLAQDLSNYPKCVFWNPTTNEFRIIPSSPFEFQSRYMQPLVYSNDFCYDHVRDDYKVIRRLSFFYIINIDEQWVEDSYVDPMWEIYSLRSNSWRKLNIEIPCCNSENSPNEKAHVDGMCHWLSLTDESNCHSVEPHMVSFDLYNEVFLTTPLLSGVVELYDSLHLTLLNGSIAFILQDQENTFHVRILGELGVKESWTKIFIVDPLPCIERLIGMGIKGSIFFKKYDNELIWFDLSTRMIEEIGVKGCEYYCQIIIYKDGLLPIENL